MAVVLPAQSESRAAELEAQLVAPVAQHVAIIMDGNGRWGRAQGLDRHAGHRSGIAAIRRCVTACRDVGVRCLSLYSFSTENLSRPADEVEFLFGLFSETLDSEVAALHESGVRIVVTGLLDWLPDKLADKFRRAVELTGDNTKLTLNMCVMYSGRAELLDAVRGAIAAAQAGKLDPQRLTEAGFRRFLYQPDISDPDLVIRTSGEQRISNFLLWQIAYSELVFSEVLWPDFARADFLAALLEYQRRERRFGAV